MTENHAQPSPTSSDAVVNPLLLQAFAWDLPADSTHWCLLADNAALLADCGVSAVWLPPAYKGQAGVEDVGYGVYDTYDLGEFDQKGTVPTKYGTKEALSARTRQWVESAGRSQAKAWSRRGLTTSSGLAGLGWARFSVTDPMLPALPRRRKPNA